MPYSVAENSCNLLQKNSRNLLQKDSLNLQNWRSVKLFKKGNGYNSEVQQ